MSNYKTMTVHEIIAAIEVNTKIIASISRWKDHSVVDNAQWTIQKLNAELSRRSLEREGG